MSSRSAIHELLRAHETGDYFARLVNHPVPHPLRQAPTLIHHSTVNAVQPQLTVVTPTFNCSAILADYVAATVASASLPFDWILVDDASDDGTPDRARALFESLRHPLVARATIVRNPIPIYETACDNQGFTLAETDVIIEIQCDIQVGSRATTGCSCAPSARLPCRRRYRDAADIATGCERERPTG